MTATHSLSTKCASCGGPVVDGACEDCGRVPAGTDLIGSGGAASSSRSSRSRRNGGRTMASSSIKVTVAIGTGAAARVHVTHGSTSRRRALGGGLVSLPPQPSCEPLELLMQDPTIPAHKRVCPKCAKAAGRDKGFCTSCGAQHNFTPGLKAGDLISGQYRVEGPIAYGGLGWIYLARDELLNRWVVLKGLLNSKDEEAAAAAMAERQYLAAVKHPKIVQIFNFIHRDTEGFIVMEFVGGRTIRSIRRERGPLPVAEAIAYILGILPAFSYLHGQKLVYCDFKSDNFMLEGDDVKLIDMGAVRKIGDPDGAIYATVGYEAPETAQDPTALSDLYTIGRTLAQLIMDFPMADRDGHELPYPETAPVLQENESLKLLLDRACAKDPALRFQDADEMFEQLFGVLREVVCLDTDQPKPGVSDRFLGDGLVEVSEEAIWRPIAMSLPRLRPDPEDPAAGSLMACAGLKGDRLSAYLAALRKQFPKSKELTYAELEYDIGRSEFGAATTRIQAILAADPYDWKCWFEQGRIAFLQGDYRLAAERFARIRAELPGEPAAQLALALALEAFGEAAAAEAIYDRVSKADPSYASAAFGLSRCRIAAGDRAGAVAALGRIPSTSALHTAAQMATVRVLISDLDVSNKPRLDELRQASDVYQAIGLDNQPAHLLAADLFLRTAAYLENGASSKGGAIILGRPAQAHEMRLGAEQSLRRAARFATDQATLYALVDRANQVRPRTFT
jgi:serine/threonine-protein kinase PknG